jgi:type IV pilus assembly protein PilV
MRNSAMTRDYDLTPSQSGFTLIEVLVTVLILAIGLLGIAGLQASSMTNNHNAQLRSIATLQAYDLADRMRANRGGITYDASGNVTASEYNNPVAAQADCATAACSTAAIADNDFWEWNQANAALLPNGAGTVALIAGTNNHLITVTWNERERSGMAAKSFTLSFRP